jgi:hypothetical protein
MEITSVAFEGDVRVVVSERGIFSASKDSPKFTVERMTGGEVRIVGPSATISTSIPGFSIGSITGGTVSMGNTFCSSLGRGPGVSMQASGHSDGSVVLNGQRYVPYVVKRGPRAGTRVLMYEGWETEFGRTESPSAPPPAATASATDADGPVSKILFGSAPRLRRITASGASIVTVAASVAMGESISIDASEVASVRIERLSAAAKTVELSCTGTSSIDVRSCTALLDAITVNATGKSTVGGGEAIARQVLLNATGMCQVSNFVGEKSVVANATGMSHVSASARPGASVSKHSSGMSSVSVNIA